MVCKRCKMEIPEQSDFCNLCGAAQQRKQAVRKRGNGSGTAIRRGKTWTAIVSAGSYVEEEGESKKLVRMRRTKGGFKTKSEALEYAPVLLGSEFRKVPTILDLWKGWSKNELTKLSDSKQTAYEIAKDRLKPIWTRTIDSLTTDDLQAVVNNKTTTFYPAKDMKSLLSHFYKKAMANQFVTINLARFIVLPELLEEEPIPFSEIEVKHMWEAYASGDAFVGYILLMIYSGMMPGELFDCKKDMIDFDAHEIYGCGKKTKKRKETPIVFSDFVEPVIRDLCEYSKSRTGKLLCMNKDKFYDEYYAALERYSCRKLTPYSCRHTTATDAVKKNIAPSVVQELMRHTKITTTQRYIHMGRADAHEAANSLRNAMAETSE